VPRILFDKSVPWPLKRYLAGHQILAAEDEGWAEVSNGQLIALAEKAGYEALVTCDQNIQYQQNLTGRKISLVILGSNIWTAIQPMIPQIVEAVNRTSSGSFEVIDIAPPPKRRHFPNPGV